MSHAAASSPAARGDKPAAQHTPTPWRGSPFGVTRTPRRYEIEGAGGQHVATLYDNAGDGGAGVDVAFIVRAVNAHDALVAALHDAVETVAGMYVAGDDDDPAPLMLARWRAALALAEQVTP